MSTIISELPAPSSDNIALDIQEQQQQQPHSAGAAPTMTLDERTISQIVNGLQQASLTGATALPSRDIPMETTQLAVDPHTQPNYVPPPEHKHYIPDDDHIDYYGARRNEYQQQASDSLYDELQTPLLLAVLYFLFQLPIFKKIVFRYLPFFCHTDGNYNFNGLIFVCAAFGSLYYALSTMMKRCSSAF